MSVCGQSGHTEDDSGSEEVTASGAAVRDLYKQKPASKVVRVLTVLAYLFSVSLAAILLSVYYVCVWRSPELPRLNGTELAARRDHRPPIHALHHHGHVDITGAMTGPHTGRGDSGVKPLRGPAPNGTELSTPALEDTTSDSPESTTTDTTDTIKTESLSTFHSGTNDTDVT